MRAGAGAWGQSFGAAHGVLVVLLPQCVRKHRQRRAVCKINHLFISGCVSKDEFSLSTSRKGFSPVNWMVTKFWQLRRTRGAPGSAGGIAPSQTSPLRPSLGVRAARAGTLPPAQHEQNLTKK